MNRCASLFWIAVIAVLGFACLGNTADEETSVSVPFNPMIRLDGYSDTPHPLLVWIEEHRNDPAIKSAGYPFDALDREPPFDSNLPLFEKKKSDPKIQFPSHLDPAAVGLIQIAQALVEIHANPSFTGDTKQTFLADWIQTYREALSEIYSRSSSPLESHPSMLDNRGNTNPDYSKLVAGFIVAGNTGLIRDVTPFLEYADRYVGSIDRANESYQFAGGRLVPLSGFNSPQPGVSPAQRIYYWPAANALVSNPTVAVPLLQSILLDPASLPGLRERASVFLLELAPTWFTKERLKDLNEDECQSLFESVSGGFAFRKRLSMALGTFQTTGERKVRQVYQNFMKLRP